MIYTAPSMVRRTNLSKHRIERTLPRALGAGGGGGNKRRRKITSPCLYWAGILGGFVTLPTPPPLYHTEQISQIGLSLLFQTNFANRVTYIVSESESECFNLFTIRTNNQRV